MQKCCRLDKLRNFMAQTIIPFHSDLHRDIALWLQANRNLTPEDRIVKVKMMLYLANLDELTLLHYAANAFTCMDALFVMTGKMPDHFRRGLVGGKEISERLAKTSKAKYAAKKRHEKTNLAKDEIRKIWATGKYTSRDICAEQECANLQLSFSTARKALRGTPSP